VNTTPQWLSIERRDAPLVVSLPHTGTEIPPSIAARLVSSWLARKDTDWWIDHLYDFATSLGATVIRTAISRTVIDVNRDPSGASLYPGQTTTGLCPIETFDGEALYRVGEEATETEIAQRRRLYFEPYHAALMQEIERLRRSYPRIVLYDCHSIRSFVPRLFEGELPHMNIGTNAGRSCDPALLRAVEAACAASRFTWVTDARFKGGWITRHYGRPAHGVHAVQMELACRCYMAEPKRGVNPDSWPIPYDAEHAAPVRSMLRTIFESCIEFASRT
jgi:N-formylglutamate deformylase